MKQKHNASGKGELVSLELTRLFNEVNAGFFCRDILNDEYIYLSAGCEKIYGYPLEAFHRNTNLWFEVIHPDDKHIILKNEKLLSQGIQILSEYRIIHYDQNIRWLEMKIVPVIIDGKLCRVEGILSDITDRKKQAEEKERITADLLQRNIELRQFSYIISHDLRSPISKILGLVSLLQDSRNDQKYHEEILNYLENEAANLDNIVRDLNTLLSRRDTGIEHKSDISFETEFKKIVLTLETEIDESGASITADFSAAPNVSSVRSFIYSIMFNLLSNAIKYRSRERPLIISVKTSRCEHFICISVTDNGLGINLEKYREKIFGLYSRFHTDITEGKGMGLNLVKTQADTLGGKADVESVEGQGSTFKVFLPFE